jgi:ornithine cyclodeaminase
MAVKAVSVFSRNAERGLPTIHAVVLVFDPQTGMPTAILEGASLTAIRTGAGSGAATDVLARPDSRVAAIFGAGTQARTQLEAICTVRPIKMAWIFDPNREQAESLIEDMAGEGPVPSDLRVAEDPAQATSGADIICTATTSHSPVFSHAHLKPGVHINGIGSYTPEMQEIPAETVLRAQVVVDSREAVLAESGDIIQLIEADQISPDHIHAELGEILDGRASGRTSTGQITFFKSVGVAVQDAAAAQLALHNATKLGLGTLVSW